MMAQSSGMGDIIWLGIIGVAAYFGWQWWQSQSVAASSSTPAQPAPGSNMPAQPVAPTPAPQPPLQPLQTNASCQAIGQMVTSWGTCQP